MGARLFLQRLGGAWGVPCASGRLTEMRSGWTVKQNQPAQGAAPEAPPTQGLCSGQASQSWLCGGSCGQGKQGRSHTL